MSRAKRASHPATNNVQKRQKTAAEIFYLTPRSVTVSPEIRRQRMCANLDRLVANLDDRALELVVRTADSLQPITATKSTKPTTPATIIAFKSTPCREPKQILP